MSANNMKFFDFEVYPNWWCCAVSDEEDEYPGGAYDNKFDKTIEKKIKDKMRIYTSDEEEAIDKLKADLKSGVICGYNIKKYDMPICKCIFSGFKPARVKLASNILIRPELATMSAENMRIASFIRFGWNEAEAWQDLLDDSVKSLKDKECALGIDIRETTVPFDKETLTEQDKLDIIKYNKHDVYALHVVYVTTSKSYIDTKIQLCDIYNLSHKIGYTNTNATLSGKVLGAERVHGTTITDPTITIHEEQLRTYFETWLPPEIFKHLLTRQDEKTFELFENEVTIADGGLHSVYKLNKIGRVTPGLYIEATSEYGIWHVDASSCYPSVMLFCGAMSRAIKYPERLKHIYSRRLELKKYT